MLAAHFNIQELPTVLLLGANTATEAGADDTSATEALLAVQAVCTACTTNLLPSCLVPGISEQCGFSTLLIQSVQRACYNLEGIGCSDSTYASMHGLGVANVEFSEYAIR